MNKKLIIVYFILGLFGLLNYASADVIGNLCNYHRYETFDKLPKGYLLLERYRESDKVYDEIYKEGDILSRLGGQYGGGDYYLYLIPKSYKKKETSNMTGDDRIEVNHSLTSLKKKVEVKRDSSNEFGYVGFGLNNECYPRNKLYHFEASINGDTAIVLSKGETDYETKSLSYYEKKYGEKYKTYKVLEFFLCYLFTIFLETLLLWLLISFFSKDKQTLKRIILTGVLCSGITLPLLRYLFPLFLGEGNTYVIVGEILVFLIESVIIKYSLKFSWMKSVIFSLICNLATFVFGLAVMNGDPKKNAIMFMSLNVILLRISIMIYFIRRYALKTNDSIFMRIFVYLLQALLMIAGIGLILYFSGF